MSEIKKNHVVQMVARRPPQGTGVVKWVGKNGDGTLVALVRWDATGSHVLHRHGQLRIATIALKAYDRLGYERTADSESK